MGTCPKMPCTSAGTAALQPRSHLFLIEPRRCGMARTPSIESRRSAWRVRALCVGEDPELFFPLVETDSATERARAVCRRCPVLLACRDWAVRHGEADGV